MVQGGSRDGVQSCLTVHCRQKLSALSNAFNQLKLDKKRQEEDFAAQEMELMAQVTSKVDATNSYSNCGWLHVAGACVCICRPQSATSRKVRAHVSHSRRRRSTVQGLPEWGRGLPDNVSGHGMGQSGLRGIHLFPDFICSSLNEWRFLQGRL